MSRYQPLESRHDSPEKARRHSAASAPARERAGLKPGPLRADTVAQLQQLSGNAAVQRYLAGGGGAVQRQKARGEAEAAPEREGKAAGFDLDRWLSGQVYDAVKGQLGEAKLKGYAKQLARKAADLLLEQVGEVTSEADLVQKAQHKIMGDLFAQEVAKAADEILQSPAGEKAKELILAQAKQEPASVIGLVLTALAYMAATNADIPAIELEKKLGKGFSLEGKANLGKFQALALKEVKLGIAYSSQAFQAGLSGSYTGEKPKVKLAMREEAGLTSEEKQFKADSKLTSAGDLTLDLNLKSYGLKTSLLYGGPNKWMGVWEFRLGGKKHYWAPKLVLGPDDKLTFALGHSFISDAFSLYSTLKPGEASLSHYVKLDKPFGAEGLSVEASVEYRLDEPKLTGLKFAGQYKLLERKPEHAFPVIVLKVQGQHEAGKPQAGAANAPAEFSGLIVLAGSW